MSELVISDSGPRPAGGRSSRGRPHDRSGEVHAIMGPTLGQVHAQPRVDGRPATTSRPVQCCSTVSIARAAHVAAGQGGLFLALQYRPRCPEWRSAMCCPRLSWRPVATRRASPRTWSARRWRWDSTPSWQSFAQRRFLRRREERLETLQLAVLGARFAILDEIDSGLDVDALGQVSRRIERPRRGLACWPSPTKPVARGAPRRCVHIFATGTSSLRATRAGDPARGERLRELRLTGARAGSVLVRISVGVVDDPASGVRWRSRSSGSTRCPTRGAASGWCRRDVHEVALGDGASSPGDHHDPCPSHVIELVGRVLVGIDQPTPATSNSLTSSRCPPLVSSNISADSPATTPAPCRCVRRPGQLR